MTTLGYILSGAGCLLIVSAVVAWLIGGGVGIADRYEGRHISRRIAVAVEDETPDEPCCCGRPGCDGTGPWPDDQPTPVVVPQPTLREEQLLGDTLTLVGTELVHRRCADARRDGGVPGQCCAARLAGVL